MGNNLQIVNTGLYHCYINGLPIVEAEFDMADIYKKVARISSLAANTDLFFSKHTKAQKILSELHGEGDRITKDFLEEGAKELLPIFTPFQRWIPEGAFGTKPLSEEFLNLIGDSNWINSSPSDNFVTSIEIEAIEGEGSANILVNGELLAVAYFANGVVKYDGNIRNNNPTNTVDIQLNASGSFTYSDYNLYVGDQSSLPSGITYYESKIYTLDRTTRRIYRYTADANGDLVYDNYSFDVIGQSQVVDGLTSGNGKLYMIGSDSKLIYRYSIDANGDLTYDNYSFSVGNFGDNIIGRIAFGNGKLYASGVNPNDNINNIYRYSVDLNGDLTYDNYSFDAISQATSTSGMTIKDDKLYLLGFDRNIYSYSIDVSGDLTYDNYSFDVSNEDDKASDIAFNDDLLYMIGYPTDSIYKYYFNASTISKYNYKINSSKYDGSISWIKALSNVGDIKLPSVSDDIRVSNLIQGFVWNNINNVVITGVMLKHTEGSANVTISSNNTEGTEKSFSSGTIGESYVSEDVDSISILVEDATSDFCYDLIINTLVPDTIPSPRFEFDSSWNPGKIIFRYQNMDTRGADQKLNYTSDTLKNVRIDPNTFENVQKYLGDSLKNYVLKELYETIGHVRKANEYFRKYEQSRAQAKFWVRSEKGLQTQYF